MPLKIGFIEEMKTTWGSKQVLQTFSSNSLYSQLYHLIHLSLYHLVDHDC